MVLNNKLMAELGLTLFIGVLAFIVAWPYVTPLIFAGIVAYFSLPVFNKLNKKLSPSISAILICLFFAGLIGYLFNNGISFAINEIWNVYTSVSSRASSLSVNTQEIVRFFANNAISYLSNLAGRLPYFVLSSVIFFLSLFYFLKDGRKIVHWAEDALPIPARKKMQVLTNIQQNVDAFVYVTLFIGLIQAFVAGVGFYMFGIGYPLVAALAAGILSLLPVIGPYALYLTASLILFAAGDTMTAIGLALYGLIIGSILDYSLRPMLLSKKARIHPLIIFIGVFGGISIMGLIGVIIGPIILSIAHAFFKDLALLEK
jgi:predicted PurR-regulated permease PerM